MHHGRCHAEEPLKVCLGGCRTVNPGVVVDEREVLPLLGCERLAGLDHYDRTFSFIRNPSLNSCKSVVHGFERSPHPWLFTLIRFSSDVAGEIVQVVERQVSNESRSERLCGLETFFQLGIDTRPLNDQIALTWRQLELDSVVWRDPLRSHVRDRSDGRSLFLAPRTSAATGQRPVLERQSLHAAELGRVVRHEPEPERARVSGDEEVIGSDHLAAFL